ncbi:hypothetical protein BDF19DRAFT_294402 [Syncephalis fuscata]|nr:hypothetical protein BDF19DRAFT_294402 [Syncephalis fuscata]
MDDGHLRSGAPSPQLLPPSPQLLQVHLPGHKATREKVLLKDFQFNAAATTSTATTTTTTTTTTPITAAGAVSPSSVVVNLPKDIRGDVKVRLPHIPSIGFDEGESQGSGELGLGHIVPTPMFTTPQRVASPSLSIATSANTDVMYGHPDYRMAPYMMHSSSGGRFPSMNRMRHHPPGPMYDHAYYAHPHAHNRPGSWADWHSQPGGGPANSSFTEEFEVVHYDDLMVADKEAHRMMRLHEGEGEGEYPIYPYPPSAPSVQYPMDMEHPEGGLYYNEDTGSLEGTAPLSDWGEMIRVISPEDQEGRVENNSTWQGHPHPAHPIHPYTNTGEENNASMVVPDVLTSTNSNHATINSNTNTTNINTNNINNAPVQPMNSARISSPHIYSPNMSMHSHHSYNPHHMHHIQHHPHHVHHPHHPHHLHDNIHYHPQHYQETLSDEGRDERDYLYANGMNHEYPPPAHPHPHPHTGYGMDMNDSMLLSGYSHLPPNTLPDSQLMPGHIHHGHSPGPQHRVVTPVVPDYYSPHHSLMLDNPSTHNGQEVMEGYAMEYTLPQHTHSEDGQGSDEHEHEHDDDDMIMTMTVTTMMIAMIQVMLIMDYIVENRQVMV